MPINLHEIDPPDDADELAESAVLDRSGHVIANLIGAFDWNPDLHPRHPIGTERGGEFIKKGKQRGAARVRQRPAKRLLSNAELGKALGRPAPGGVVKPPSPAARLAALGTPEGMGSPNIKTAEEHQAGVINRRLDVVWALEHATMLDPNTQSEDNLPTVEQADRVKELVDRSHLIIRTPSDGWQHIFGPKGFQPAGRVKKIPEWQRQDSLNSNGDLIRARAYMKARGQTENDLFGAHPIYGMFTNGAALIKDGPTDNESEMYGGVVIVPKKEIRDRTSYTYGDSLNSRDNLVPAPVGDSSVLALERRIPDKNDLTGDPISVDQLPGYVEGQIYGKGLKPDDIEQIIFTPPASNLLKGQTHGPSEQDRKLLAGAGIPWAEIDADGKIIKSEGNPTPWWKDWNEAPEMKPLDPAPRVDAKPTWQQWQALTERPTGPGALDDSWIKKGEILVLEGDRQTYERQQPIRIVKVTRTEGEPTIEGSKKAAWVEPVDGGPEFEIVVHGSRIQGHRTDDGTWVPERWQNPQYGRRVKPGKWPELKKLLEDDKREKLDPALFGLPKQEDAPLTSPEGMGSPALEGMGSPPGGWTSTDEEDHPIYPASMGDKAGEPIRVGDRLELDGTEWEVAHILLGKIVLEDASGKKSKVKTRIIDPAETAGPKLELGGATPPPVKKITLGTTGQMHKSNVKIIDPYVDPKTHDPNLKLPTTSKLTEDQWKAFGEVEQLHYIDLMNRYGEWKTGAPINEMVKSILGDFDSEIVNIVRTAHGKQYNSSTGGTLSLSSYSGTPAQLEKRSKAMDLQGRLRDVIAWDYYNRLKAPDIAIFHGSHDSTSWWHNLLHKHQVFSGMSQSFDIDPTHSFGPNKVATPMSIRNIVLSTNVSNWTNASSFIQGEREVAIVSQFLGDLKKQLVFNWTNVGPAARKWLTNETKNRPRTGSFLDTLRDHMEKSAPLPVSVDANIQIAGGKTNLPPPEEAPEAMQEHVADLPKARSSSGEAYDPSQLSKKLPWRTVDADGNPVATEAKDAGLKPGDFMIGKKGTLYWIGPDANDAFGLRYYKIIPDENGKLHFNNEDYGFEGGGTKSYYFLKGNVQPQTPEVAEKFDNLAWQFAAEDAMPISLMAVGTKFKVDAVPYQKIGASDTNTTPIRDLETDKIGTITSAFKAVRLVPAPGYFGNLKLQPAKGMTLAVEGKKAVVTSVKKDGVVSVKPTGQKVTQLAPDDPALAGLFNPADWEIGDKTTMGALKEGDMFHGGRGKETIKPFRVIGTEGKKVKWENLDTGEKGLSLQKKTVSQLDPLPNTPAFDAKPKPVSPNHEAAAAITDDYLKTVTQQEEVVLPKFKVGQNHVAKLDTLEAGDEFKLVPSGSDKGEGPTFKVDYALDNGMILVHTTEGTQTASIPFHGTAQVSLVSKANLPKSKTSITIKQAGASGVLTQEVQWSTIKPGDKVQWKGEVKTVKSVIPVAPNDAIVIGWEGGGDPATITSESIATGHKAAKVIATGESSFTAKPLSYDEMPDASPPKFTSTPWIDIKPGDIVSYDGKPKKVYGLDYHADTDSTTVHFGDGTTNEYAAGSKAVKLPSEAYHPALAVPTVVADDIDALPVAEKFVPYKSAQAHGGDYVYDKIQDMPVGTVLKDKKNKKWKVQINDAQAVITDGKANFQIDGSLRGQALPGQTLNSPPPPTIVDPYGVVVHPKMPEPGVPIHFDENVTGLTLAQIPENSLVKMPDSEQAYVLTHTQTVVGQFALVGLQGGLISLPSDSVPSHVDPVTSSAESLPIVEPPYLIEPNMADNTDSLSQLYANKAAEGPLGRLFYEYKGQTFMTTSPLAHYVVLPNGATDSLAGEKWKPLWHSNDIVPDKIFWQTDEPEALPPEPSSPEPKKPTGTPFVNMEVNDEFEYEGKPYKLVILGSKDAFIKDMTSGMIVQLPKSETAASLPADGVGAVLPSSAVPEPEDANSLSVLLKIQAEKMSPSELAALPKLDLPFFKSGYGSGGKYKHWKVGELKEGDHFTVKGQKNEFIWIKSVAGGYVMVYSPTKGGYGLVDATGRVRLKE